MKSGGRDLSSAPSCKALAVAVKVAGIDAATLVAEPRYPAYVFHYTDYSSGRKDPLKKDIRVAPTEAQIVAIFDASLAENVKKGWNEVV